MEISLEAFFLPHGETALRIYPTVASQNEKLDLCQESQAPGLMQQGP